MEVSFVASASSLAEDFKEEIRCFQTEEPRNLFAKSYNTRAWR
jgi:hypothetical protein